jgi:hypothetical protein
MNQAFISGMGRQEDARQLQNGSSSYLDIIELFALWKTGKGKTYTYHFPYKTI